MFTFSIFFQSSALKYDTSLKISLLKKSSFLFLEITSEHKVEKYRQFERIIIIRIRNFVCHYQYIIPLSAFDKIFHFDVCLRM